MPEERAYWLAWSQISGIGAISLKRIARHFGSLKDAWNAPANAFGAVEGLNSKAINAIIRERTPNSLEPEQLLKRHLRHNPQFWTPDDSEYPRLLQEIPSPPPLLYYCGRVLLAENQGDTPLIGIVGTRYPTEYGRRWTSKITRYLVKHGFGIVSGMAAGIDAVAHDSCIKAGGRTIAVLGTGVDTVYPLSNRQLYRQIEQNGLIVSEYPAQTKPERGNFPARNRIIAGLCRAVLIMEAPKKSGALITARFANDFNRDVYVLPGSLDNSQSLGCLELLNRGAHVILSEEHLLEMLGTMPYLDPIERSPVTQTLPQLEPELERVFQTIGTGAIALDAIAQKTNLPPERIMAALSQLEIMDLIVQLPGMRYRRT
ncbi:DNA-processing protein DprA [Myxosarcina sp. GI1]|uniref:DNA-processing protein DprA n=1 Tax=Myxosarcina sp. GI1 TaxID=1541065 RepID=UPI000561409A|nr:DNA-processing protein DprA [Myxosarcina sp. GI1]